MLAGTDARRRPCRTWNIEPPSRWSQRRHPRPARSSPTSSAARVSGKVLEDATLLVSELVTNAVRHAPKGGSPEVELRLKLEPERVRVVVSDPGAGLRGDAPAARPPPRAPDGVCTWWIGSRIGGGSSRRIETRSGSRSTWTVEGDGRRRPRAETDPDPPAAHARDRWRRGSGTSAGSRASSSPRSRSCSSSPTSPQAATKVCPAAWGRSCRSTAAIFCGPDRGSTGQRSSAAWSSCRSSPTSSRGPNSRSSSGSSPPSAPA